MLKSRVKLSRGRAVLTGAILVGVLGSGCTAPSPTEEEPTRRPEGASQDREAPSSAAPDREASSSATAAAAPSPVVDVDVWLDTAESAPADAGIPALGQLEAVTAAPEDGAYFVGLDVASPGTVLASKNVRNPEAYESLGTPHLGWLTESGFEALPYDDANSAKRQITYAAINGRTVTWVETSSRDLFKFDWQIYSAIIGEPGRQLCGDSAALYGKKPLRPVFGQTRPVQVGANIYWTGTAPGDSPQDSRVFVCQVGTETPRMLIKQGMLVSGNGRDVFYVRQQGASSQIIRRNDRDGAQKVLVDIPEVDRPVTALDASSTHVAWVVSTSESTAELYVKNISTGRTVGVQLHHPGNETMFLSLGSDAVVWGNGSSNGDAGQYLLDLSTDDLLRLGKSPGYSVAYANEEAIAWAKIVQEDGGPPQTVFETARYDSAAS